MKKLFYSLSLALIGCVAANAATPAVKSANVNFSTSKEAKAAFEIGMGDIEMSTKKFEKRKASQLVATSIDDYIGNWQWNGRNALTGVINPNEGVMTIEKVGNDQVVITGMSQLADAYAGGLKGYFKNNRIYIPNQSVVTFDQTGGDLEFNFINYTIRTFTQQEREEYKNEYGQYPDDDLAKPIEAPAGVEFFLALINDGKGGANHLSSVYYEVEDYTDDANLAKSWSAATIQAFNPTGIFQGWNWFCTHIQATPLVLFSFNPNEWTYAGDATYKDPWFSELFNVTIPPYTVELYRSTRIPDRYLLLDPYGPNTPYGEYGINASGDEGYVVLDLNDPDCVIVEPFVYALTMDDSDVGATQPELNKYYLYNLEGYYYYIQGTDTDQIRTAMRLDNQEPSYLYNNEIEIHNGIFDVIPLGSFASYYGFYEGDKLIDLVGYVQLPENYDSVDSVISDTAKGPAQYFNLQGVRVNNPAKGEIVIIREGNKSRKTIMR